MRDTRVFVPRADELIQGVAFGDNGGELVNTCSAVALSIALNYLAAEVDGRLVPPELRLERRRAVGRPRSGARGAKAHADSNAHCFHCYLVNECGLGPRYLFGHLTWGVWGPRLAAGFKRYLAKDPRRVATGIGLKWHLGGVGRIVQSIDAGIPALITTWPGPLRDHAGVKNYGWHTMVVYGYRRLDNGKLQLCVHSGWFSSKTTCKGGVHLQDEIWISPRAVCFSYVFERGGSDRLAHA